MSQPTNGSPASSSWEDAETQPQLSRNDKNTNNNATAINNNSDDAASNNHRGDERQRRSSMNYSSSLDLDKTLPLPADVEAELMESQLANRRQNDDEDDLGDEDEGTNLLVKLKAWISPKNKNNVNNDTAAASITSLSSSTTIISESDVASLLSFTAKLRNGEVEWNHVNYTVIKFIVQLAMLSFSGHTHNSNNNSATTAVALKKNHGITIVPSTAANAATNNDNSSAPSAAAYMDVQLARRLLTDGILPFASLHNNNNNNSSSSSYVTTSSSPGVVWNAKLIQSIVIDHLLPSIVEKQQHS
ncbi:hypothetical protein ACHAXM_004575 [Skeletonema potamos]